MSDIRGAKVFKMPPLSKAAINHTAQSILDVLQPQMLEAPRALDVWDLIDFALPEIGVHVSPASATELPDQEAVTVAEGSVDDPIEILIREDQWEDLQRGGSRARRPLATVVHELGHAFLHVRVIRKRLALPKAKRDLALARHDQEDVEVFRQPEWQAWTLGMCLAMPPAMVRTLHRPTPAMLSEVFGVSEAFASRYLRAYGDLIGGRR